MPPPFCHNPEIDAVNKRPETTKARGRNRRAFGDLVRLVPVHAYFVCMTRDWQSQPDPALRKRYRTLTLKEIDIGFAGRQPPSAAIHSHIAQLRPGDPLTWRSEGDRFLLQDAQGNVVGRTSASFSLNNAIESSSVSSIVVRYASDTEEQHRHYAKVERWEVIVPQVVYSEPLRTSKPQE